jgi:hypothetical protein
MESILGFSVDFCFGFCFGWFFRLFLFTNSRLILSSRSSVYLPFCSPSSANRRLNSVRSRNPLALV